MNIYDISKMITDKLNINVELENTNISEVKKHSFLDKYLSGYVRIYTQNKAENPQPHDERELVLYHQNMGKPIEIRPNYRVNKRFVDSIIKEFGSDSTIFIPAENKKMRGFIKKSLWNNAKKIGHEEIVELAQLVNRELTKKSFTTKIDIEYGGLTLDLLKKVKYNADNVVELSIRKFS